MLQSLGIGCCENNLLLCRYARVCFELRTAKIHTILVVENKTKQKTFSSPRTFWMSLSAPGPFVMNTDEEISQAILDFRNAKNGFERAKTWKSKIGNQWQARGQVWLPSRILPFVASTHSTRPIFKAGFASASQEFHSKVMIWFL